MSQPPGAVPSRSAGDKDRVLRSARPAATSLLGRPLHVMPTRDSLSRHAPSAVRPVRRVLGRVAARARAIVDGYRCQWRSVRKPEWNDAAVHLCASLEPGGEAEAVLTVGVPGFWVDRVAHGDELEGAEGSRVIARATVREIS